MKQAISAIEVRYRRADTVGAWSSTIRISGDQRTCQIPALQRGQTYQIEARAIGTNGAASIWVEQTHIVADASQLPVAPTALTALSVADGVHLNWDINQTQRADVEYDVERTNDISGAPNPAGWANIANVKATAYTDGITDGVVRWYRVRAVDFLGLATAYSNDVDSNNKSVEDGADVTGSHTSNNTNNVGSLPTGDITSTINPGGGIDFLNPGNTNNTLDSIPDGSGRYAAVETGADKTLNHVLTTSIAVFITLGISPSDLTEVPGMSWIVISNDVSDVFNIDASIMWESISFASVPMIAVLGMVDGDDTLQFGYGQDIDWTRSTGAARVLNYHGSVTGLAAGTHTITLYYYPPNSTVPFIAPGYSIYGTLQQISS